MVSFTLRLIYSGKRVPVTHLIGDWVSPRTVWMRCKLSLPGNEPRFSARSLVTTLTELPWINYMTVIREIHHKKKEGRKQLRDS